MLDRMLDQKDTAAVNVIFKDFSKAFNCMRPSILLQRLNAMNVNSNITKLCTNVLSDRKQCTQVNSKMLDYLPVEVGVPQGTLSGLLFWLAFIDSYDIPASAIQTIKYADDISCSWLTEKSSVKKDRNVVTLPTSEVQSLLNYGRQWSTNNHMNLNIAKTKVLPLSVMKDCVYKKACDFELVDSFRFLGVLVDSQRLSIMSKT